MEQSSTTRTTSEHMHSPSKQDTTPQARMAQVTGKRKIPPMPPRIGGSKLNSLPQMLLLLGKLCKSLSVDEETKGCASELVQRLIAMQLIPESRDGSRSGYKIWLACCLFVASAFYSQLSEVSGPGGLKLVALLEATGISVNDVFKNVGSVLEVSGPCLGKVVLEKGLNVEVAHEAIDVIKRNVRRGKYCFVVMSVCYGKFQLLWDVSRNFAEYKNPEDATRAANEYAYAWLLLVITKQRLFGETNLALVPLYNLMVAVIGSIRFQQQASKTTALAKLAAFAKVDSAEVDAHCKNVKEVVDALVTEGLQASVAETSNSKTRMASEENYAKLSRYYGSRHVRAVYDFDERIFLNSQLRGQIVSTPAKQTSKLNAAPNANARVVPASVSTKEAKQSRRQLFSDETKPSSLSQPNYGQAYTSSLDELQKENPLLRTPSKSKAQIYASPSRRGKTTPRPHMTPFSSAMEASNWLRRELQDAPLEASEHLRQRFFGANEEMLAVQLALRIQQFEKVIEKAVSSQRRISKLSLSDDSRSSANQSGSSTHVNVVLRSWLDLVTKLYYRTLEAIMRGESERIGHEACTRLLRHEMFMRSVYMLCFEVIARSKELFHLVYPVSRKLIQVPPMDLLKIFDCFVKYLPSLPRVLRKHLSAIEDSILEEEIWQTQFLQYTIETIKLECARSKEERTKNILLQKVFRLAQERIRGICCNLFSEGSVAELYHDALQTLQVSVMQYPDVLKDRQLDHVIMCAIYSSAKLKQVQPSISFKRISRALRTLRPQEPHAYNRIIRDISLRSSRRSAPCISAASVQTCTMPPTPPVPYKQQQKSDRITYYNHVFLPRIKRSLLEKKSVQDFRSAAAPASPNVKASQRLEPRTPQAAASIAAITTSHAAVWKDSPMRSSPPLRVKNTNVYVSPRRSRKDTPTRMTPRTRALYAFGESPSSDLRLINHAVRGGRLSRLRRGPSLDDDGDERAENSAKRARIDRIGALLSSKK